MPTVRNDSVVDEGENPRQSKIEGSEKLINAEETECIHEQEDEETSTTSQQTYKWYNVNVEFLPAKCGYFFESGKKAGYLPNQILFLISVGLTSSESGIILGLRYLPILNFLM